MEEKRTHHNSYTNRSLADESINLLEWNTLKTQLSEFAPTKKGKRAILGSEIPAEFEVSKRLLNETIEIYELENTLEKLESNILPDSELKLAMQEFEISRKK